MIQKLRHIKTHDFMHLDGGQPFVYGEFSLEWFCILMDFDFGPAGLPSFRVACGPKGDTVKARAKRAAS